VKDLSSTLRLQSINKAAKKAHIIAFLTLCKRCCATWGILQSHDVTLKLRGKKIK